MLEPVDQAFRGIWSGEHPLPDEYTDFALMKEMGWSWDDLQATPGYVRMFSTHFLSLEAEVEAERAAQTERDRPPEVR